MAVKDRVEACLTALQSERLSLLLGFTGNIHNFLSVDNKTVLETEMIFIMHPNQYIPETGYLMCGEPVRIGAASAEPLTRRHAVLDVVAV